MADDANATATTEGEPKKTEEAVPVPSQDPDEMELQAALKEVEDEAKEPAATTTEGEQPPAETPKHADESPKMVPVGAVQDERGKRQEAETLARKNAETAIYWKGVAEGRYPDPRRNEPETPEPSTTDKRGSEIKSEIAGLANQVDAGTLSFAEYQAKRQPLDDEYAQIRDDQIVEKVKAAMPKPDNDLRLQELTGKIESENPWLEKVPNDEIQMLIPFARQDLAAKGIDLDSMAGTAAGDLRLREALVERAKVFGYDKRYGGAGQPAKNAPAAPVKAPTEEQRKAKEQLALTAPPTPIGTHAPGESMNSERVDAMSSLDLETMPMGELKKLTDKLEREATSIRTSSPTRR